jgi:hypothetical protein
MSPRIFKGKLFRIAVSTVKPKRQIIGDDGKARPGAILPEMFWYSKVACIISLEATNEAQPDTPNFLTQNSRKPFSSMPLKEGEVGRRELGVGNRVQESSGFAVAVRDGSLSTNLHNPPESEETCSPATSPSELSSMPEVSE